MGKIMRAVLGEEPKKPAERVLERCGRSAAIDCWTSPAGALAMAVYLERHGAELAEGAARIRIAYTSFHPEPITFTRGYECEGGRLEDHDRSKEWKIPAGRTEGRRWRTARVPGGVAVEREAEETQIEAEIAFVGEGLQPIPGGVAGFSVLFEGDPDCSCC